MGGPEAIQLALFVIEQGIKNEPKIEAAIRALFSKANPTAEDWQKLRQAILSKSYEDFVPHTALKG